VTEYADLPATELLRGYGTGEVSPVELMEAVIRRIEAWEHGIAALYDYRPEAALAAAREAERRWRSGEARALEGVPVTIKENIATKGTPMPLGTAARELAAAPEDAPAAARLREAGALIVAKTTMPDYGMMSSGLSSFHALTRNPWDLTKNPGGSSSGAGGGRCGRLWPAPSRDRYRRVHPAPGGLVRACSG
jgi:Asp-tRNA(Asn)/Glu-tRNA(Gln) amidotransferase A subunit family amidase